MRGLIERLRSEGSDGTDSWSEYEIPSPDIHPWHRLVYWILLSASRRLLTILMLIVVYAVLMVLGLIWPFEIQTLLTEETRVQALLTTLLSGVILLVSIVVSINSLVVSQELASIGNQYDRVKQSWEFRSETADALDGDVSPARPNRYLRDLLDVVERETKAFEGYAREKKLEDSDQIAAYTDRLSSYVQKIGSVLADDDQATFDMRLFAPAYDPGEELDIALHLKNEATVPDELGESLETLVDALQFFMTAREYFKTMYYKREFARLSRDLLYTGLPTVVLLSYMILALDAASFPGRTAGLAHLYLFFSMAYVLALSPFVVLASYVLRAAVVAENTVTTGAFVVE